MQIEKGLNPNCSECTYYIKVNDFTWEQMDEFSNEIYNYIKEHQDDVSEVVVDKMDLFDGQKVIKVECSKWTEIFDLIKARNLEYKYEGD